ncbi:MAG: hypothetical protein PF489_15495 [Salinivirgaceae bacterium]|jgi:hypothetical protein|nr:hypothetical protein [Salinivirgaceae bacterium]
MKVFENNNVAIDYDRNTMRLTQTWSGFATTEAFRQGIEETLKFVIHNQVKTVLSDALKQHVVKPEDAQYAASVMPQLKQNGMKAMAFVVPESAFTKLSLQKFSKSAEDPLVKFFMSKNEANQWLGQQ